MLSPTVFDGDEHQGPRGKIYMKPACGIRAEFSGFGYSRYGDTVCRNFLGVNMMLSDAASTNQN